MYCATFVPPKVLVDRKKACSTSARIITKAIKAKIHEGVFARVDLERPVFTVVDEWQRYISNDPETDEQAYLDRCRGYRGMALYATQSLASLAYALGADSAAQAAINILLANIPTKILLCTSDEATVAWLRAVLPGVHWNSGAAKAI
ncbi:hypothetical protein ACHAC9_23735 [Massilia sp. CMS3.1]|uniref:hypothetical protein n=1 Tax=Massilia sp. CMS3.1 TaxID=3373083 RepID=UPI003EE7553F